MIADIGVVLWKEAKEIMRYGGNRGWLSVLILIAVYGIFIPWQMGRAWIEEPLVLLLWAWVPLFLVSTVIADSFAGERERHTLETLLATRLSDQAILLGKVGAGVAYGWTLTVVSMAAGVVTVNLAFGQGRFLFYPLGVAAAMLGTSLLAAGLMASAGVLVSLRAATVRQAAQSLSLAVMLLLFVPIFGVQALPPEWQARLMTAVSHLNTARAFLLAMVTLALINLALLTAAKARFRRARLLLD